MDITKKQYHHGDLRSALLEAAAQMIVEAGVDNVTMRALSQKIGVSRSAPYRHYPDKTALLCAVAEDGFRRLKKDLQLAIQNTSGNALLRFENMSLAYVNFAVENSAHYRLMFGNEVATRPLSTELQAAAKAAFEEVIMIIEACQQENRIMNGDSLSLANVAWATVHGLSMLIIDGQIQTTNKISGIHTLLVDENIQTLNDIQQLAQFAIKVLIDGMKIDADG